MQEILAHQVNLLQKLEIQTEKKVLRGSHDHLFPEDHSYFVKNITGQEQKVNLVTSQHLESDRASLSLLKAQGTIPALAGGAAQGNPAIMRINNIQGDIGNSIYQTTFESDEQNVEQKRSFYQM